MGSVNETIQNVNNTLRTVLTMVLVAGAGYAGYVAYDLYNQPQKRLAEKQTELEKTLADLTQTHDDLTARQEEVLGLTTQLADKTAQVERLDVAMQLLKVRRRLGRLTVLDQSKQPDSDQLNSRIEFVEVNEEGQPIGETKQFDIAGDMVYVDYLRVTFDDKYVEEADLDRSTAICLFQRIFGEHQEPADGYQLDRVGTRPTAYARGNEVSAFEKKIWDDFWLIANDSQKAAALGIHAAHGDAVSIRVQPGKVYEIELRSVGDITIRPLDVSKPNPTPPETVN